MHKERKRRRRERESTSRWPRDSTRIKESALNLRNSRCKARRVNRRRADGRREEGSSGVVATVAVAVAAAATTTAAVTAAENAGAAFWVSGFVPGPLTPVHQRHSRLSSRPLGPRPPPPPPLHRPPRSSERLLCAAHECGTVGQRTP